MSEDGQFQSGKVSGVKGAIAALVVNGSLMGLAALSFTQGPYSSQEQELWYRYGSITFVVFGAVIPAAVLTFAKRRPWMIIALTVWMVAVLFAFLNYALLSGGGA